jgi:hypothetical protein
MFHTKCKSVIFLNISGAIAIAATFDIGSSKNLVLRELYLAEKDPTAIELSKHDIPFYCLECAKSVKVNEISTHCSFCSSVFPIEDLKCYKPNSGIYCSECIKRNELDENELYDAVNAFRYIRF